MQQHEIFLLFTAPLERAGFEYMATGSVAAMVYGTPRFTNDLDVVLLIPPERINEFVLLFPLREFYCPPIEALAVETRRPQNGHFNIIHHQTGYKADMYVCAQDELHRWAMQHKKRITLGVGGSIDIAPPEYVIIQKLIYFREGGSEKHLQDIRGMLAVSGDLFDYTFIKAWIDNFDLNRQWDRAQLPN